MLIAISTVFTLTGFAQGIGLIVPNNLCTNCGWGVSVPREGFELYDQPYGSKTGTLTKEIKGGEFVNNGYRLYLISDTSKLKTPIEIIAENSSISIEENYLDYFEEKNGFVRVIVSSNSYWINLSNMKTKKFRRISWQVFYSEWAKKLLAIFSSNQIDIKSAPSLKSKTIQTIRGDLFLITPTNEHSGNWSKVVIKKYKIEECTEGHEESLEYKIEGWIKVIDDLGKPLLDYYSSC